MKDNSTEIVLDCKKSTNSVKIQLQMAISNDMERHVIMGNVKISPKNEWTATECSRGAYKFCTLEELDIENLLFQGSKPIYEKWDR